MKRESGGRLASKRNLLLINYATDERNQVFAHQIEVIRKFSKVFHKVYVITGSSGHISLPENVMVIESKWTQGKRFTNSIRFIVKFLRVYSLDRNIVVFSHMTEVQSALISPLTRVFRIKHIVWYAHASRSIAMNINQFLLDGIATSTSGSCPYTSKKVSIIGQAIDDEVFKEFERDFKSPYKFVHVGRTDPSKKIEVLIQAIENLNLKGLESSLTIVGGPSNPSFNSYAKTLHSMREGLNDSSSLLFCKPIERRLLPNFLISYDYFIHAFQGSLDKSLVEATMCGMPVLTLNQEYRNIFGQWDKFANSSLEEEFLALNALSKEKVKSEISRRREIAVSQHSLSRWVKKISELLVD